MNILEGKLRKRIRLKNKCKQRMLKRERPQLLLVRCRLRNFQDKNINKK